MDQLTELLNKSKDKSELKLEDEVHVRIESLIY